jgi:DNA-directed RNA polymerase specialized sigma24 family protein
MTSRPLHVVRGHEPGSLDVGALAELYDRHASELLRFASRVGGAGDAEDLVQTTFLRAVKVAATYDGRGPTARNWLFGILVRVLQERQRSMGRFASAVLRLGHARVPSSPPSPGDRLDLERGLQRMAPAKRVVLVLAEVEGFTCEEIAVMLGIPIGTVWTRLHHGRKELRKHYEEGR